MQAPACDDDFLFRRFQLLNLLQQATLQRGAFRAGGNVLKRAAGNAVEQ